MQTIKRLVSVRNRAISLVSLIVFDISVNWHAGSSLVGRCPVGEVGRGRAGGSVKWVAEGSNEQTENAAPITAMTEIS